jgi:hypothetical protein
MNAMYLRRGISSLIIAGLLLCSAGAKARHDVHISFGKATLKSNILEAKLTIYKDDLLRALANWHAGGYAGMNSESFQQLEIRYVSNYFRVWSNSESQLALRSFSISEQDASVTFSLDYAVTTSLTSITVDSRILFREYIDQANVHVIEAFGREENHVFTSSSPTLQLQR